MRAHAIVESGPDSGRRFVLRLGQQFVIGRGQGISAQITDELVSRRHGSLELQPDGTLVFRDLGSRNRSFHNNRAVTPHEDQSLVHGDRVQLGKETVLRFEIEGDPELDVSPDFLPDEEFEVLGELGTGASGKVFAAKQRLLQRVVAIKVLLTAKDAERERLLREARVAQRIRSPYVVEVHDVRLFGEHLCLIMELINGPSLRDQLRAPRPLSIPQAIALAEDVAQALVAVHHEGVVHRDIKPANLLVHPDGYAVLADFGLAKDSAGKSALTGSNIGMGSLSYVAPEQACGAHGVDRRADLYALGATLFHLISQRPPHKGTNMAKLLEAIVEAEPPALTELEPDCPAEVADLVHRLLAKAPDARPHDAAEVLAELEALRRKHFPGFVPCVPGRRTQPQPHETHGGRVAKGLELRPSVSDRR